MFSMRSDKRILISITLGLFLVTGTIVKNDLFVKKGLKADYFSDTQLEKHVKTQIDEQINFHWKDKAPFSGMKKDNFSIQWTGTLIAPMKGRYHFLTISDDGVRLWLDDQLIIDNWTGHSTEIDRAIIDLSKGNHQIRLDYNEYVLYSEIKLLWKKPDDLEPKIISSKYLRPHL